MRVATRALQGTRRKLKVWAAERKLLFSLSKKKRRGKRRKINKKQPEITLISKINSVSGGDNGQPTEPRRNSSNFIV